LIGKVDFKEPNLLHLRLMEPRGEEAGSSINAELIREGYANIDRKGIPGKHYAASYPVVMKELEEGVKEAKSNRMGIYEYGDVEEDSE